MKEKDDLKGTALTLIFSAILLGAPVIGTLMTYKLCYGKGIDTHPIIFVFNLICVLALIIVSFKLGKREPLSTKGTKSK